jgi:hypothetical protein
MAGTSVQFVGLQEIMKAFDNAGVINWSVWQGKNPNFYYGGDDENESRQELEGWLKMIAKRSNQAIYTLKFFEDWKGGKIPKTAQEDFAFNFRVLDEFDEQTGMQIYKADRSNAVVEEIRLMRAELKEIKEKAAVPGKIGNTEEPLETWEKILDHPITMGLVGKIFGIDMAGIAAMDGKLSGVPGDGNIDEIIEKLWVYDNALDTHLYKLLQIAEKNPGQFKMFLAMLDKM